MPSKLQLTKSKKIRHTINKQFLYIKKITAGIFLIILTCFSVSCGTILDTGKIIGKWKLVTVEFFDYHEGADSYINYSTATLPVGETEPSYRQPVLGNFFFSPEIAENFYIVFNDNGAGVDADGEFLVYFKDSPTASDYIINGNNPGKWKLDSFNNRITCKIPKAQEEMIPDASADTVDDGYGIWQKEFSFSNDWPLSSPEKMELLIKAKDADVDNFNIEGAGVTAIMMKGYFEKQ